MQFNRTISICSYILNSIDFNLFTNYYALTHQFIYIEYIVPFVRVVYLIEKCTVMLFLKTWW